MICRLDVFGTVSTLIAACCAVYYLLCLYALIAACCAAYYLPRLYALIAACCAVYYLPRLYALIAVCCAAYYLLRLYATSKILEKNSLKENCTAHDPFKVVRINKDAPRRGAAAPCPPPGAASFCRVFLPPFFVAPFAAPFFERLSAQTCKKTAYNLFALRCQNA